MRVFRASFSITGKEYFSQRTFTTMAKVERYLEDNGWKRGKYSYERGGNFVLRQQPQGRNLAHHHAADGEPNRRPRREMVINRNKNTFRAIRERVGITQASMARMMGVSQRSVRYWGDAGSMRNPPQQAWSILEDALREQQRGIAFAMQKVDEIIDVAGDEPETIKLPYWLSESEYPRWSTDSQLGVAGDRRMANASNMALALRLEECGLSVEWVGGNLAQSSEA